MLGGGIALERFEPPSQGVDIVAQAPQLDAVVLACCLGGRLRDHRFQPLFGRLYLAFGQASGGCFGLFHQRIGAVRDRAHLFAQAREFFVHQLPDCVKPLPFLAFHALGELAELPFEAIERGIVIGPRPRRLRQLVGGGKAVLQGFQRVAGALVAHLDVVDHVAQRRFQRGKARHVLGALEALRRRQIGHMLGEAGEFLAHAVDGVRGVLLVGVHARHQLVDTLIGDRRPAADRHGRPTRRCARRSCRWRR